MITIYSTTFCQYCKLAKAYLDEKNISYKEINVQEDDEAAADMIRKSGQMGVPVLDINGKIIVGFDRGAIDEALKS